MHTIALTDLPAKECHRESFRDESFRVLSRSGLHPTERALLKHLSAQAPGDILIAGNRTGALGLILATENPGVNITQHVFDIHHAKALQRTLAANDEGARILVECTPFMPELPTTRLALLQATARDTPAELILDQLEDLNAKLPPGATCLVAYDGKPDWLRKQMKEIFGQVKATPVSADVTLFTSTVKAPGLLPESRLARTLALPKCTGTLEPEREGERPCEPLSPAADAFVKSATRRNFSATFDASLPGETPLQLTTLPGVFAHRRADEGGLALAEVASRTLEPGARVFDMGCGCGLVGLLLARHAPAESILCADSHARAIYCTEQNARANALTNVKTLLTDAPTLEAQFTLFVGNPPYYSDYKIAELFIRAAHQALAPGGTAFIVAKNHRWHEAFMQDLFGNTEVIKRRGYGVVRSLREPK